MRKWVFAALCVALAFVAPVPAHAAKPSAKTKAPVCRFEQSGTTVLLRADCTTTTSIVVPDGATLDGGGHTITAVDPADGRFTGGVIESGGTSANVMDVTIVGAVGKRTSGACQAGDAAFRGILFDNAAGSIRNTVVRNINVGDGSLCAEGDGIVVQRAPYDGQHASVRAAIVEGNVVVGAQNVGILVHGDLAATVHNNRVEMYRAANPLPDGRVGIKMDTVAGGSSAIGNRVNNGARAETNASGIVMSDTMSTEVRDNKVSASKFGIVVQSLCIGLLSADNRLSANRITAGGAGVHVVARVVEQSVCGPRVDRTFVSGNVIGGGNVGVQLAVVPGPNRTATVDATDITRNRITGTTTPIADGGTNTVIGNNTIN